MDFSSLSGNVGHDRIDLFCDRAMSNFIVPGLDFDELAALAKEDPERFELIRQQEIERVLSAAPASIRKRLLGLQWRIDIERERADTPFAACRRLSRARDPRRAPSVAPSTLSPWRSRR